MRVLRIAVFLLAMTAMNPARTLAQPGQRSPIPALGTAIPEVSLFDATGAPFHTSQLRGEYSVVVFGCLT